MSLHNGPGFVHGSEHARGKRRGLATISAGGDRAESGVELFMCIPDSATLQRTNHRPPQQHPAPGPQWRLSVSRCNDDACF